VHPLTVSDSAIEQPLSDEQLTAARNEALRSEVLELGQQRAEARDEVEHLVASVGVETPFRRQRHDRSNAGSLVQV
jgi:hypothetical protein